MTQTAERMRHEVVRASAGSGKTYRLAAQYLRLFARGADPSHILATTFTRKAAGEILARVLGRLAQAALCHEGQSDAVEKLSEDLALGRAATAADCRNWLAAVAAALPQLAIGTIDSYFNRIVQSFRLELGIAADVRIVAEDDPLAQRLRRRALRGLLEDGRTSEWVELLRQLAGADAGRSVAEALDGIICDFREVYLQATDYSTWNQLEVGAGMLQPAGVEAAVSHFAAVANASTGGQQLAKALGADLGRLNQRAWETLLEKGLFAKFAETWFGGDQIREEEPTYYGKKLPPELLLAYRPLVAHAVAVLLEKAASRGRAIWRLLHRFESEYGQLRRREGVLVFDDLARLLVERPPVLDDLYYRLDSRVRHLLVDEFQDTSRLQWQVLRPLAEEITAHGDGSRSFFCVGDRKQAIYGWRGGCAEIFDSLDGDLRLEAPPGGWPRLDRSYRSSSMVLDAVNTVFQGLSQNAALGEYAEAAEDWQSDFRAHEAAYPERRGHVQLLTYPPQRAVSADADEVSEDAEPPPLAVNHAEFLAQLVVQLAQAAPERSVGVLLRRNKTVSELLYVLRRSGVDASGEAGNTLTDDPGVNLVRAALRLADHPGDPTAAFHVLHSPLAVGLQLRSLAQVETEPVALRIRRRLLDEGYAAVIADWTRQLAGSVDARGVARLQQLVELAEEFDRATGLRPDDFVRLVAQRQVEEPRGSAVRVMTIHRAKGLEFDTVVLPELDGPLVPKNPACYAVRRLPMEPVTTVFAAVPTAVRQRSPQLREAHRQFELRQVREELCTLYVGMTRAKSALYMLIHPLRLKKDGDLCKRRACFSSILRGALAPAREEPQRQQTLYERGDRSWYAGGAASGETKVAPGPVRLTVRMPKGATDSRRSWPHIRPSSLENAGLVDVGKLLTIRDSVSLQLGTLLHSFFSLIQWLDDARGVPADQELAAAARSSRGVTDPSLVSQAVSKFKRMVQQPRVVAALGKPAGKAELWRERPFAVRVGRDLLRGIFDRVVIHYSAERIHRAELLDFKTDNVEADGKNLPQLVERYRPQLSAYRQALAAMVDLPTSAITAKLLFLTSGDCLEV